MTARLSFSVAQVRRFIRAAKEEGCRVVIRPDRIEVVDSAEMPIETARPREEAAAAIALLPDEPATRVANGSKKSG